MRNKKYFVVLYSKPIYMLNKKSNYLVALLLGGFFLTAIAFASCNNSGDAKDAKKDSPAVEKKMDAPKDSVKMDKATDSMPVHTP